MYYYWSKNNHASHATVPTQNIQLRQESALWSCLLLGDRWISSEWILRSIFFNQRSMHCFSPLNIIIKGPPAHSPSSLGRTIKAPPDCQELKQKSEWPAPHFPQGLNWIFSLSILPNALSSLMATWGYSLRRNNSCETNENDCGQTWDTWHSCCPESSICPVNPSGNNGVCCPYAGDGCSRFVTTSDPQCPEASANIFQNHESNATICCSNDTIGFYLEKLGFVGCAKDIALAASSSGNYKVRMMDLLSSFAFTGMDPLKSIFLVLILQPSEHQ